MQKSIAIIIGYFGNLPWYFDYFIHSCKYNPDVHFYVITDNEPGEKQMPKNVFLIKKSLEEMKNTASFKLGLKVKLDSPYKFCDLRPSLAYILPEYIEGYDFWGYGDIDVIYGNIRLFITNEILMEYDVISVRTIFCQALFHFSEIAKKLIYCLKKVKTT